MVDVILSFLQNRADRRIEAIVRQVADLSVEAVADLVDGRTAGMSICELRGYIRARAGLELRRQTRLVLSRHPEANPAWATTIADRAGDRIAPLVIRRLATAACRRHMVPVVPSRSLSRAA